MTNNGQSRLDRLEALATDILEGLRETREGLRETREGLQETKAIANSNSRAIQAMMEQQTTDRLKHEEAMNELRQIMAKVVETQSGMARMLASLDEDRPTILRKLNTIENKLDRLIDKDS